MHTVVQDVEMRQVGLTQLPDGHVFVGTGNASIRMLEGFPPALMGHKPTAKPPEKTNKRAFAGDASGSSSDGGLSSSGAALKRGCSGAGQS